MDRNTKEAPGYSFLPGIRKLHTSDFCQDIDPYRGNSNLIDNLLAAECLIGNSIILERRTEFPES